jgi:hypothetical protein
MATIYVFMLLHRSEPRYYLGATSDLPARLAQLGAAQVDLYRSRIIAAEDSTAFQLEGVLHNAFAHQRRTALLDHQGAWYEDAGWGRITQLLSHLKDLLPHEVVQHPLQVEALRQRRARERWPEQRLKAIHEEQERRAERAQAQAAQAGQLLQSLLARSSFTAVVRTDKGYVLVGQAPLSEAHAIHEALDGLQATTGGIDEHDSWDNDEDVMCYAAQLPDKPGLPEETADSWYGWCERLVWQQQAGIPGFDLAMTWQEAKRAGELLAACPTSYTGR